MFKIETWNDNLILRNKSLIIWEKDYKEAIKLGKEMVEFLKDKENGWIWLAAPQIGKSIRLIAVGLPKTWKEDDYRIIFMINPEILEHSLEKEYEQEWCLSVPWKKGNVGRYIQIKVRFLDENKKSKTLILKWISARVVQHEIDHLNGILFIDYLS
jgi:peptide deformylase